MLYPYDVRDLLLSISRAERKWTGERAAEPTHFLCLVRKVNDYLRQHEPDSDEAMEFQAEVRAFRGARNVFYRAPTQKIPWRDLTQPEPAAPPTSQPHSNGSSDPPHQSSKNVRRSRAYRRKKAIKAKALWDEITAMFEDNNMVDSGVGSDVEMANAVEKDETHGSDLKTTSILGTESAAASQP